MDAVGFLRKTVDELMKRDDVHSLSVTAETCEFLLESGEDLVVSHANSFFAKEGLKCFFKGYPVYIYNKYPDLTVLSLEEDGFQNKGVLFEYPGDIAVDLVENS